MRIAVLHPAPDPSTPFAPHDPDCDPARHLPEHDWTDVVVHKATAVRQVQGLARAGFDVVVNLCDGAWDEPRPGVEVVQALERADVPFTGASSAFYDPTREAMKLAATSAGIAVPAYVMVRRPADVERAIARLRFPLIVKPNGRPRVRGHERFRVREGRPPPRRRRRAPPAGDEPQLRRLLPRGHLRRRRRRAGPGAPNTWLDGLDLVARRPIATGEPLAVDYATFCGPSSASFECSCGAEQCRGVVRGTDFRRPELVERYRGHVSDFVRAALGEDLPADEGHYEVVATVLGSHLMARRSWWADELVDTVTWGPASSSPSRSTIELPDGTHADAVPAELRHLNHSCDPNVVLDVDAGELRTLRGIDTGDELTIFYPSTEWAMAEPFACGCGSPRCIGMVSGAKDLPAETLADRPLSSLVRRRLAARCP